MKRTIKGVVASLVATFVLSIMPLSVLAAGDMEINSTNFGSDTFADYLISIEKSTSGCNGDGKFSSDELSLIKSLKPDSSVTRIIGLKAFPNLTTLDVSACTSLTSIIANDTTSLTTLKLGSITNLEYLYAKNTAISSVDVTKCTKLKRIYLSNAPITSIDLSKNRALAEVLLDGTSITSLDISACPNIYNLDISNTGNAIESLDIVNNYLLIRSGVGGTKTTKGNIVSYERTPNGEKRFLRVDKETEVYCSIDEKSVPDEAFRNIVKKFDLDDDDKFSMDELKEVKDVHFNGKYEVASVKGVEMFYNLESLEFANTKITSLDLKNNPSLTRLTVFTSDITSIDLSKTPLLQYLTLHSDIYVDISNLTELVGLDLSYIKNVELDLSNQPNLKTLMFSSRATKSINLKNNTELESLVLCYTGISQLDLSANTKLDYAAVNNNLLTELDLTNNPNVEMVNVSSNPDFQTLKVADNNKINTIYCDGCNITELDLSHLNLHTLHCNDNHISELDLSNQKRLGTLICYNNDIATLNLYGTRLSSSIDSISEQDNKFVSEYQVSIWLTEVFMCDNTVELVGLENFPSTMPTPTETPTVDPTVTPTPTKTPVVTPTVKPTVIPTAVPTATVVPTVSTTPIATVVPTLVPTATGVPTNKPIATVAPTIKPTSTPDVKPSLVPEVTTTVTPSVTPEVEPSKDNGVGGFIERLYTVAMGRDFDEAGKDYWVNEIKVNGQTGAEVALQFLFSDEFLSKDMTEDEFLTILYRTFFDREPEAAGLAYWKGEMQSGKTKEWVIAGFINSPEWANICLTYGIKSGTDVQPTIAIVPNEQVIGFATRLYTTCLGRDFDPEGLDYWARELANLRQSGSEVAKGFFFSPEFVDSKFDDSEYLTRLYKTVMGREPEKDGFNYWMGELKSGNMTRESVFDGFAASPEWIGICADYGILR